MCIAPTQVDGDVVTSDTSLQSSGTTPSVTFSFEKVSHYYLLPYIYPFTGQIVTTISWEGACYQLVSLNVAC